jgi:serine/threonine protein kinase
MKLLKNNTFTDIYVQQTVGISGEIQVFKLKLKSEYAENKPLRSHFFSSAKALKSYSGKQFLTFLQLIDNEQEAAILFQTKTAKSLPEYLAEKENLSDKELTTLFEQMAQCLGTLHQGMLFYPALQPNSFYVDSDGQVQLSFFDILEFRMYQYQQKTPDSKFGFMNYLSPERKGNFFSISLESDIYSLGLIYWHVFLFAKSPVKNWKLITENTYFSPTETDWDSFFESCLQENWNQRDKSINALVKALPRVGNEVNTSQKNQTQTTAPSAIIDKEQQNDHTSQNAFETREPKQNFLDIEKLKAILKKRKVAIAVVLILVIVGLFKFCNPAGTIIAPPKPVSTVNATSNEEVSVNLEEEKKVELINPEGITVKPGKEAILTENGLNKDGSLYRYYNGKWEVKPKTADVAKSNWQPLKDVDKSFIIALFFSVNSLEKNKKIEEEKKNENCLHNVDKLNCKVCSKILFGNFTINRYLGDFSYGKLKILSISKNEDGTILFLSYQHHKKGNWVQMDRSTYIVDKLNNKRHFIKKINGLSFSPNQHVASYDNEIFYFNMHFSSISSGCFEIDLIESNPKDSPFKFYGIKF